MDTVGDFLTIIRNAVRARLTEVGAPFSKMRLGIAKILKSAGYIEHFEECTACGHRQIRIALRFVDGGQSPITVIERCSRPGRRIYANARDIPRVLNGLGIAILSTSSGLMKDSEARRRKIGGEVLCKVY
jgi:small subunit ribosomal protein S8